jgi:glycyl-tRNA synthetase
MKFKPRFAPIKLGIFPLVNKEGMPEVAEKLYLDLRNGTYVRIRSQAGHRQTLRPHGRNRHAVSASRSTGRPIQDQTVTVRHRDDCKQERIALDKVRSFLVDHLDTDSRGS